MSIYVFRHNYVPNETEAKLKNRLINIINVLLEKCPEFIKEKHFNDIVRLSAFVLTKIISNYYVSNNNNDDRDECFICLSNHKALLIPNICKYKNQVHLNCLAELSKYNHPEYKACLSKLNIYIDKKDRVLFPTIPAYPQPSYQHTPYWINPTNQYSYTMLLLIC